MVASTIEFSSTRASSGFDADSRPQSARSNSFPHSLGGCCEDDFSHLFIWKAHGTTVFVPSIVFCKLEMKSLSSGDIQFLSGTTSHQVFLLNFWAYLETICWDCCQDLSEWSFTTRFCFCIAVSIYHTYSQEWHLHSSGAIIKNIELVNTVSVLLLKPSVH